MAARKKAVVKSTVAKNPGASKASSSTTPIPAAKLKAIPSPLSKTMLLQTLAEQSGLTKKDVSKVVDALGAVIEAHLKKRGGGGVFSMPGLFKIITKHKPAQKARKGIHPITKEPATFKAKPASVQVKVRPLKKLKEMAQ